MKREESDQIKIVYNELTSIEPIREDIEELKFYRDFLKRCHKISQEVSRYFRFELSDRVNCKGPVTLWFNLKLRDANSIPELENEFQFLWKNRLTSVFFFSKDDKEGEDVTPQLYDEGLRQKQIVPSTYYFPLFTKTKFSDKSNPEIITLFELFNELSNDIIKISIERESDKIAWSFKDRLGFYPDIGTLQEPTAVYNEIVKALQKSENKAHERKEKSNYLNLRKFRNFDRYLQAVLDTSKEVTWPNYVSNQYREKIENPNFNPKNFYSWNLSLPGSPFYLGSIMVFSEEKIPNEMDPAIIRVKDFFHHLLYQEANYIYARKSYLTYKSGLKSAIAAIMARNVSHNIGSHVISGLSYQFNMPSDDLVLFKYIQHRSDFIAQITTEWPSWTYPVWLVRDLMRKFYMQSHLLNYIVESEGITPYKYQNNLGIAQDKGKLVLNIEKEDNGIITHVISINKNDEDFRLNNDLDIQLAIPGGTVGYHAFYVILENFIRNVAKHQWQHNKASSNVEINLRFRTSAEKNAVQLLLYSNIPESNISERISDINKRLRKEIVNGNGELIKENWGLAEVKIAVGYLNKKDPVFIGQSGTQITKDLIRATRVHDSEENLWGYEFSLPRPKEILVITNNEDLLKKDTLTNKFSIHIKRPEERKQHYDFELVIIDCKDLIGNLAKAFETGFEDVDLTIESFPGKVLSTTKVPEALKERVFRIAESRKRLTELLVSIKQENDANELKTTIFGYWTESYIKSILPGRETIYLCGGTQGGSSKNMGDSDRIFISYYRRALEVFLNHKHSLGKETVNDLKEIQTNYDFFNLCRDRDFIKIQSDNEEFREFIKTLKNVKNTIRDVFLVNNEDIETLPKSYRASQTTKGNRDDIFTEAEKFLKSIKRLKFIEKPPPENQKEARAKTIYYKRHSTISEDYLYAEALSGAQIYFNLLINGNQDTYAKYFNDKIVLQLIENAITTLLIIDERVYDYYLKADEIIQKSWRTANIVALDHSKIRGHADLIRKVKKEVTATKRKKPIYLLVHQGILDKSFGDSIKNDQQIKGQQILAELKQLVPNVIVTSGRGKPENIPKNEKFLPFSTISDCLMNNYHEKFLLMNILYKLTV